MDPRSATERQIAQYRGMTGQQRVEIALRLHELACDVARAGIRAAWPGADEAEVERRLRERIALSYRLAPPSGAAADV